MEKCLFCSMNDEPSAEEILETIHWRTVVHYDQYYFGRCTVFLKRHAESLETLTVDEWADLKSVIDRMESFFRGEFGADLFNWACLMNLAYRAEVPNPHVHFHFRPRYRNAVEFEGETFLDPEFGGHYQISGKRPLSEATRRALVERLKESLSREDLTR